MKTHFFQTCVAYIISLMLVEITKIRPIRNAFTMDRVMTVIFIIYGHSIFVYGYSITFIFLTEFTRGYIVKIGATTLTIAFVSPQFVSTGGARNFMVKGPRSLGDENFFGFGGGGPILLDISYDTKKIY